MDAKQMIQQVADVIAARIRGDSGSDPLGINSRPRDAFFISFDFDAIAALASNRQTFTMDTDADFLALTAVGDVRDNAAPQTRMADPAISASIKLSSSGRELMNIGTHWANLFGTAQLHTDWPAPKFFAGGSSIAITLTNLLAAGTTYKARITFWGFKLFAK